MRGLRERSRKENRLDTLQQILNSLLETCRARFLQSDPLELVRKYTDPRDREVAAFVSACFAIGRMDLVRGAVDTVLERMGNSPFRFIMESDPAHVIRLGKKLGLTQRSTPDWKMAVEITQSLRLLDPLDPVKYDFALCHAGMMQPCPRGEEAKSCRETVCLEDVAGIEMALEKEFQGYDHLSK